MTEEEKKEKKRKDALKHYYSNKEYYLNEMKRYREEHPEVMKKWRDENKDHISEYNKKHSKTKMGRANNLLNSYRRNDRKHNRGECTIKAKWIVENIFSKCCVYCGETDWTKLGCDRIDNSKPHTPENVVPCCKPCNSKKGTMSVEEYKEKMLEECESP